MVIGNGMIAKEFSSYGSNDAFIIFASGVSDSTHSPAEAFEREEQLLSSTIEKSAGRLLVYFSTCSIYDLSMMESAYVKHKNNMEELIIKKQEHYVIFRLSNPIGSTNNNNTVFNFFIKNILEKHPFRVWKNASRNIIDIDDVYLLCNEILQDTAFHNKIINIANPKNYPVPFIVETIEKHFAITGNYTLVERGDGPYINVSAIEPLFKKFNINFGPDYLPGILQKYFPVK
jgi:nucleoside-diphosphate-sugar epimerase